MQDRIVKKLFTEQTEHYSQADQTASKSPLISLFLSWVKGRDNLKICEFGGAGGILLDKICQKTKKKIVCYNAELVEKYQKYQANKKIKFCLDSVLGSKFPDNYFDAVIIRDVLHHLIGKNYSKTRQNQAQALSELKRLTKPGGVILIEELVNHSKLAVKLIYWISKINSKLGIRIRSFEISPYTIIALFTPQDLKKEVEKIFGKENITFCQSLPDFQRWQDKITHLGAKSGKLVLIIQSK